ncbi:hypothetical protein E2C01_064448 [Portunus trituberculatus]|uniref:Uncharacterized protein n=1 Tax=Portunus trituberculatus TaxID=210409 RepID=A0A5B7HJT3_PORTR|nr:hypothetical protein [Portunus trituberculatus]
MLPFRDARQRIMKSVIRQEIVTSEKADNGGVQRVRADVLPSLPLTQPQRAKDSHSSLPLCSVVVISFSCYAAWRLHHGAVAGWTT